MKTILLSSLLLFGLSLAFGQDTYYANYPSEMSKKDVFEAISDFTEIAGTSGAVYEAVAAKSDSDFTLKWSIYLDDDETSYTETLVHYILGDSSLTLILEKVEMIFEGARYDISKDNVIPEFSQLYDAQVLLYVDTLFKSYLNVDPIKK